jgi:hypothetical protein
MTHKPNADTREGSRKERAAWMKQVNGPLWNRVYRICTDLKIIDEAADTVATNVRDVLRLYGKERAKRTALAVGGVGRR